MTAIETHLRELVAEMVRAELDRRLPERAPVAQPVNPGPDAEYIDDRELSEWIGLSRETLQQLRRGTDGPPFVRVARRAVKYHVPTVRAWLERRTVGR